MGHQFEIKHIHLHHPARTKNKQFNMNSFAFAVIFLTSVATAAPGGGWTVRNQHSYISYRPHPQASNTRQAPAPPALKSIAATAAGEPALSTLLAAVKAADLAG